MAQPEKKTAAALRPVVMGWYDQPPERVAGALYSYALALEAYQAHRRIRNAVMYRLVTGEEPPVQMGLWMSRKAASSVATLGANYTKPYSNIMSNGCSVLENRIGTIQPFVQISPSNVSYKVRSACKHVTDYIDAIFENNKYNGLSRLCFRDLFIFGMAFVKVTSSEIDGSIGLERVLSDQILVDEISAAITPPVDMLQRCFMRRSEVWAVYGGKDARTDAAIRTAQSAFANVQSSQQDDWIVLLEGWKLPDSTGKPGRHVLCLQNKTLVDEKWTRKRFPIAVARWQPPTMNYYTPGGAFIMAPYQMEVNHLDEQIRACIRAAAYPVWLVQDGSGVSAQTMGMRPNAVFKYQGSKPEHVVPQAVNSELYQYRKSKENDAYASVGITGQQVQGQKQQGVTAGKAIAMLVDYEDARNKGLTMTLEGLGSDVAEIVLDESEESKPTVQTTGVGSHPIKWDELAKAIKRDQYKVKPFPINAFIGSPADAAQDIQDAYANGEIDRRAFFRLQQLPDLATFANYATASDDLVEATLDEIVETGKFIPPEETYDSLPSALKTAQARFNLEKKYKSPRPVLRALYQFMAVLADMIQHPDGQMLQPPAPMAAPAGAGLPSAGAPAPPPLQVAASMAPPQQLAA